MTLAHATIQDLENLRPDDAHQSVSAPLPDMGFSERVEVLPEALSIYINQLVYDLQRRGHDIVSLSLVEAFFDIPLFDFKKLDIGKCYHYSDSRGIPELRDKIAKYYGRNYNAPVDPASELLITAGSKPVIFMAMQATLNPGDEVLIHEPAWLSYPDQAKLVGARPRFIPYDTPVSDFGDHIGPNTRMVVINNPNNPAGRVYSRDELQTLYELCRRRGIYILIDEAYSDFVIDEPFTSMASLVPDKDGVIIVNSLSKNMGMSGWRVGYAIGSQPLIDRMLKLNQHINLRAIDPPLLPGTLFRPDNRDHPAPGTRSGGKAPSRSPDDRRGGPNKVGRFIDLLLLCIARRFPWIIARIFSAYAAQQGHRCRSGLRLWRQHQPLRAAVHRHGIRRTNSPVDFDYEGHDYSKYL